MDLSFQKNRFVGSKPTKLHNVPIRSANQLGRRSIEEIQEEMKALRMEAESPLVDESVTMSEAKSVLEQRKMIENLKGLDRK